MMATKSVYLNLGRALGGGSRWLKSGPSLLESRRVVRSSKGRLGEVDSSKKYDTVVSSGQSALRALLTMNGGATVAFLAFIGHIMEAGSMPFESGRLFVGAMQLFIYGTFLAVLAYGTIFLTNCLSRVNRRRASDWMFVITVLCGFASLVCFLTGSLQAIEGFRMANESLSAKP